MDREAVKPCTRSKRLARRLPQRPRRRQKGRPDVLSTLEIGAPRLFGPMSHWHPPWLHRTLSALEVRKSERVLLCLSGAAAIASAVRGLLSRSGGLTVLENRWPTSHDVGGGFSNTECVVGDVEPGLQVGRFDVVIVNPLAPPPRDAWIWTDFVARHLRPGGRYFLDLPAPEPAPDALAAANDSNLPCAATIASRFQGPPVDELVAALKRSGLRTAEALLGTQLVPFESPYDVAHLLGTALRLDADAATDLGEALARRCKTSAKIEIRMQRSMVVGMR